MISAAAGDSRWAAAGASAAGPSALLDSDGRDAYLGRVRELLATRPDTRDRTELDVAYLTTAYRLTPR